MPRHSGEFYPHPHCTVASGDCFTKGRCLSACTARQKRDQEQRIRDLETRVRMLEAVTYRQPGDTRPVVPQPQGSHRR